MTIFPRILVIFKYYLQRRSVSKRRDRLSRLPDDVLLHILSFLATDRAVSTSLLSTRWRRTWASVPVLLLDSRRFNKSPDSNEKFIRFVDNVIVRRDKTRIDTFVLTWPERFDEHKAAAWTSYASGHSVRELNLDVRPGRECRLLIDVFGGCPSLERCCLNLPNPPHVAFTPTNPYLPSSANLSKLRVLEIHNTTTADKLLGKLISECPVLEELSIHVDHDIEISAPNLKVLKLGTGSHSDESTVRIFAPRLERFRCNLNGHPAILLDGLRCSVYADIHLSKRKIENMKNLVMLLRSLRLAKALNLRGQLVQALSTVQGFLKQMKFNDLKYLKVTALLDSNNVRTIFMLLEGCPNLEKFVVTNTKTRELSCDRLYGTEDFDRNRLVPTEHQRYWIHSGPKYKCSLSKLKWITVNYFFGDDKDELEFMNSLLPNASCCLQKIRIYYIDTFAYLENHTWVARKLEFMIRVPSTAKFIYRHCW